MLSAFPINGWNLIIYLLIVWGVAMWITFTVLQSFFQQNKPINLRALLKLQPKVRKVEKSTLSCTNQLVVDIDKNFIAKWFIYISKDHTFNNESRIVMEETLKKILTVQLLVDQKIVVHGILNLYLRHLKEFRRGLKRKQKYGGNIIDLYSYSHICSNSTKKSQDYFIHQLTINLLNHFINWELSNSLPCRILISIIARKVTSYALNLFSNPTFLNYYIINICASKSKKEQLKLANYSRIELKNITIINTNNSNQAQGQSCSEMDSIIQSKSRKNFDSQIKENATKLLSNEEMEKKDAKKNVNYDIVKTENVKIYESKSCKTWYDSYDLESVTLGQDILDMLNESDSKAQNEKHLREGGSDHKEDLPSPMSSAKSLLDEVKQMTTIEGIKTSMKPISDVTVNTFHNIKDLQETTVNNVVKPMSQATSSALHRIGDLQDEAAGVVGGILDFGRSRIKKGLRLTGLQDEIVEQNDASKKKITKMPAVESHDGETVWINPLQDVEINFEKPVPTILTQSQESSPDPEYEETADLASSIAKLRSLLEQKSSESNISTPALSPMPDDFIKLEAENVPDIDEGDGVMPSFYKFCAKTATGVLHNTIKNIKTALPGNIVDCDEYSGTDKWIFVESTPTENDLFVHMNKLLSERKVFCTVDTAYEAFDSLVPLQQEENLYNSSKIQFEDELDDFEVKLPITKVLLDILCELLSDVKNTALKQEPVIKSILLLVGMQIEENITSQVDDFMKYMCNNAYIPAGNKINVLTLDVEEFIDAALTGIPSCFKYILGEKIIREAFYLFVSSIQVQKINQDVVMQIFELFALKLIEGSKEL